MNSSPGFPPWVWLMLTNAWFVTTSLSVIVCSEADDPPALANETATSSTSTRSVGGLALESITPATTTHFQAKLASVYLVEDIDKATSNNIGSIAMLWTSPHCTSGDDCDYFYFARPSAVVNADLDAAHERMVWTHPGMNTWYRNSKGRIVTTMP